MKTILTVGASSSSNSINRRLAQFTANQFPDAEPKLIDLNDFEMPIFSVDREKNTGVPGLAVEFKRKIVDCDAIVISLAEHNGTYSAAFKNVLDWSSRLEGKLWNDLPMFLLATSPGARGGATVLELAKNYFPFLGAKIVAAFSLPSFHDNFSEDEGIKDVDLRATFESEVTKFRLSLENLEKEKQQS